MSLSQGDCIGRFEILDPIGAGGMGEVWGARDPSLGREVAIKVLPAEVAVWRFSDFVRDDPRFQALLHRMGLENVPLCEPRNPPSTIPVRAV